MRHSKTPLRVRVLTHRIAIVVTLLSPTTVPLAAQAPLDTESRAAIMRDSVAGLEWMLPAHRDWSRYTHPGQCLQAMNIVQMSTVLRSSHVHRSIQDDTLSTMARTLGAACAAKFTVDNVSAHDWKAFHKLALALGDLSLAHAIVESQLARASTPDEKGSVVMDALDNFAERDSRQVAAADSLVERIPSFGPQALWWHLLALGKSPSGPAFDTTRWATRNAQIEKEFKALPFDERHKVGTPNTYATNTWFHVREYSHIAADDLCPANKRGWHRLAIDSLSAKDTLVGEVMSAGCASEAAVLGKPVPPLGGGQWFKPGDTVGVPSLGFPIPGHVTLVVIDTVGAGRISKNLAMYRRLHEKYASKGFDLVLVHKRVGYIWGSGLLSAAAETQLIRWYDHDYLKLPFPVAIYDSDATDVPGPLFIAKDGRQTAGPFVSADLTEEVLDAFIAQAIHANGDASSRRY